MHELSIAQNILETVRAERERNQWGPVTTISLQIGALAGVHTDSLTFGFDVLRAEYDMPDCELAVEPVGMVLSCATCKTESQPDGISFTCPGCGSSDVTVVKGYELDIVSVDVAEERLSTVSNQN